MIHFRYTAYDNMGAKVQGETLAETPDKAKQQLKHQNLLLIELHESRPSKKSSALFRFRRKGVSLSSLEFITSELALLLKSGVRFDKGLSILAKGASSPEAVKLLDDLSAEIKAGKSIADSFASFPDIFDPLYINMIKLGEASGELAEVFTRLSQDLKFRRNLQQKIIQSLTYPTVILFVCIACILFVFNYIVPQMSGLFENAVELPVYTQLLLSLSQWFIDYQLYLGLAIVMAVVLIVRGMNNKQFRIRLDEIILKMPLLGKASMLVERIRFNSSMAMMLSSGVSLVQALKLSAGTIKNEQISRQAQTAINSVKQGSRLTHALAMTPLFTDFNVSLIEVGEESGELAPVFEEIAARSKQDFEGWVQTLTAMIEPILILVMGAIVGSVVVVMLLSIVSTNDIGI
jgi:type II secretory pathway component PulF